jgi:clathrin heavy chain
VAIKYNGRIESEKLLEIFENYGSFDGLFYFLGNILPTTQDPEIYFKYIQAAAKLNNIREVERVIKETSCYDAEKVRDFLKEIKLPDPRPLIYLCDLHGYVDDLTRYLYKNKLNKFIEIYLFKVNNAATPKVLGTLIDLDCDEVYIKQVLNSVRVCPIDELVDEF